jgi:hypothetical protein
MQNYLAAAAHLNLDSNASSSLSTVCRVRRVGVSPKL